MAPRDFLFGFDFAPGVKLSRCLYESISLPDKDKPILLAAIKERATHLITGDVRHFGPYSGKAVEGILILSPADYVRKRHAG